MVRAVAALIIALAIVTPPLSVKAQQGGTTRYVYDDNGRLRAVVSPTGEAAIYEYDPAGNFTAIRRLATTALELLDFFPKSGVPGDAVTFIGVGFGAGVNSVSFNGTASQILSSDATTVVATVPQGATTGLVIITTPRGPVTTPVPFTIKGVRVNPATAKPFPGTTIQFTAVVVVPGADQSVTWGVNDLTGGNAVLGTITTTGLYSAPNQPAQSQFVVLIRATSVADSSIFGEAVVTVQDLELLKFAAAGSVSVKRNPDPAVPIIGSSVSVRREPAPGFPVTGSSVSLTKGPHITSISPGIFSRGATAGVTINGANLTGATDVVFFNTDRVADSTITVSGVSVDPSGTVMTATINVSPGSALGRRIAVISGSAGASQLSDLGTNTIEIVQ